MSARGNLLVRNSTTIDAVPVPVLERKLDGIRGRDIDICYNPEFIALGRCS